MRGGECRERINAEFAETQRMQRIEERERIEEKAGTGPDGSRSKPL
jgi:hypothetical protein